MKKLIALTIMLSGDLLVAQEVPITIEPAVEIKVESRTGFRYEIEESASLSSFTSTGTFLEGTGGEVSALFPVDGKKFYRVQEIPSDLQVLIPGLNFFSLATARVDSENNEISVTGARVISSEYDLDDFLVIDYCFDYANQTFIPKKFEVAEDLGPTLLYTNRFYPLDESASLSSASFLGASITPGSAVTLSVPAAGASILFAPQQKHYIAYQFRSQSVFRIEFINEDDEVIGETVYSGTNSTFENSFPSLDDELISFRLSSLDGNAFSTLFSFENGNRFGTSMLAVGSSFATGSMLTSVDYKKFQIEIAANRSVVLSGFFTNGGTFVLVDERGVALDSVARVNGGTTSVVLGPAPEEGTYFLVFFGEAFETNAFNGRISYLPES